MSTAGRKYVLVTAANEEADIERTIQSVVGQTQPPQRWVIVSDGSTDRTVEIVQSYAATHSKAEGTFGKREKKPLQEGIRSMAEWVNKHGTRESNIFEGIEVQKNMPPSWARVTKVQV